jgi:hypothetical protein
MRKNAIGLFVMGVAASLVLGACSSSSKSSSTGVATSGASKKVSTVPPACTGNSVVYVAPTARSDPRARAIAALLTRRYTDINQRNFADYWTLFTPEYRATFDRVKVADGYKSSDICDVHLTELSTSGDGRTAAKVTFTSTQDAADAPSGRTCTKWTVPFVMKKIGARYLFDSLLPNSHAKSDAC